MKILLVAEALDRVETGMINGLAGSGVAVDLVAGRLPGPDLLQSPRLNVFSVPLRNRYDLTAIRRLRGLLKETDYDVVHCLRNNRPLTNILAAGTGMKHKLVAYRGTLGHVGRFNPASRLSYLNPRIDRIVCVSDGVRRYLQKAGVRESKLVTIRKGHDPAWYADVVPADLSEFGISPGTFVVCCVANIRRNKGVDVLVRAFRDLPGDGRVQLLVAGSIDDMTAQREAERGDLRRLIHFAGYRTDAINLVRASDVFVMPSVEREGWPRAVIEAMCQDVPPIVTSVGGMPEMVEDGISGLVVPPRDPHAMARAIGSLMQDAGLRLRLGRAAGKRAAGEFSISRTVEQTLSLYRGLAAAISDDS